jgi:hypothetical protein
MITGLLKSIDQPETSDTAADDGDVEMNMGILGRHTETEREKSGPIIRVFSPNNFSAMRSMGMLAALRRQAS